jgi:hypothetical protein
MHPPTDSFLHESHLTTARQLNCHCLVRRLPDESWRFLESSTQILSQQSHSQRQSQSFVTTGGQSASLSWCQAPIWGLRADFYYSDSCVFVDVGSFLWREDGSVVYNCCWTSPAQSLSGPSPIGLENIFYCLRFETPPTWRTRSTYLYSSGTGWPCYTPKHW